MPLAHISLPVSNLETSLTFYLSALAPLGYKVYKKGDNYAGLAVRAPDFWLHCSPAGEKETDADSGREQAGSRSHVAFEGDSHSAVKSFYDAALKAGAKCNGPPGYRPQYIAGYYAAYVLDPDGNNIECMYWSPWWLKLLNQSPMIIAAAMGAGAAWWVARI